MLPLADILSTLDLVESGDGIFVAEQRDNPSHHIVGGHIAAQALMAASRTAPGRLPHSLHVYLLGAGDARYPVRMDVNNLRDSGSLSTRRVIGRQGDEVLLEALVSFSVPIDAAVARNPARGARSRNPAPVEEQLQAFADEADRFWVRPRWIERRAHRPATTAGDRSAGTAGTHPGCGGAWGSRSPTIRSSTAAC